MISASYLMLLTEQIGSVIEVILFHSIRELEEALFRLEIFRGF